MIITVQAYDRLGMDLVVTVSLLNDAGHGPNRKREFFGRSIVPLGPANRESAADLVFAVGEELLNLAYGYANPGPAAPPDGLGAPERDAST